MKPLSLSLAAGLVAVVSSWPTARAQTRQLPDVELKRIVDLSEYSSYAWSKDQGAAENLANHLRLINAIQDQMKAKGYRIDTVKPDARIRYRLERHTGMQTRSTQERSVWDPSNLKVQIDVRREETIRLSIEMVDAEANFLLWKAEGTYPLGSPDRAERQINAAVEDLFSQYPEPEEDEK